MTKFKSTKRALLASGLALVMCISMLIGSTFAWFTDSVTSTGNKIQAGTLKVDLELLEGNGTWTSIKDSNKAIFDYENWEPGYTDVKILRVSNKGTLALKWLAKFVSNYELSALADVIDVYVNTTVDDYPANRSDLTGWTKVGTVKEFVNTISATTKGTLEAGASANLGIALKMQENADNRYQGMDLGGTFDIQIIATQYTSENDSFDNQYDKNAWHPEMTVVNAEDLQAAITNSVDAKLGADVAVDGDVVLTANLDLGGKTLSADFISATENVEVINGTLEMPEDTYLYAEDGVTVTLENVTVDSDKLSAFAYTGGTLVLKDVTFENTTTSNPVQNYGGTLVMDNVTVAQAGDANTSWYSSAVQVINEIAYNDEAGRYEILSQANTTINSGTYTGKKAVMISAPGGNVTINGGTFIGSESAVQADFYPQNYISGENYECVVTINGGNFTGAITVNKNSAAKVIITGGTFSVDPTDYLADGYVAVENADGTYTVIKGVSTADELKKALANGDNIVLADDIELTNTLMAKKDVVIDLNGKTITAPSNGAMFQSQSNAAPSLTITSSKSGAKINAGGNSVLLGYGSTKFYNVEINVGEIKSSSYTTFKVYGDLTLGEGTVVNVDYLGTSLISNNGANAIVIDGAKINIGTFKTNAGAIISLTKGATLALNDTEVKVGLDTTYTSYFISNADNATINDCTIDVTDANDATYDIELKPDANVGAKYVWVQQ